MLPIDFQQLKLPHTPNYFLVCPENYCNATPQMLSPKYFVSVNQLINHWQAMLIKQPRVSFVAATIDQLQFTYIQRSFFFRFPDYMTVRFIPLTDKQSTLAIYSQSKYGHSDFGVNKKRIMQWLADLHKQIICKDPHA